MDEAEGDVPMPAAEPDTDNKLDFRMKSGDSDVRKMLECPVCYDIVLPPITLCTSGHTVCNTCRENLTSCPSCRGSFTNTRNLFLENFLDTCIINCKYKESGCNVSLPGRDLSVHLQNCNFRPLLCRECDKEIPYHEFLLHMRDVEKLEIQKAAECSTGFEIEDEEFIRAELRKSDKLSVWEPTWLQCHGRNFFCFLETSGGYWWVWIGVFATPEECKKYVCSITVWNKEEKTELRYVGAVHSIRTHPEAVLKSGQCLMFLDAALKRFLYKDGIDILVRIDLEYEPPKSRRGLPIQTPLQFTTLRVTRSMVRPIPPLPESERRT